MENATMGPGLRMLLLLMLIGGLVIGEVLARLLPQWGYPRGKAVMRSVMLLATGLYLGALLTVSFTSKERTLARGSDLHFCGFYFDCHMAVAVDSVTRTKTLGSASASGEFYLVSLRVSSDAIRATLQLGNPEYRMLDSAGRRFPRSPAGEQALATLTGTKAGLVQKVAPGGSYHTAVVFDLPADARSPRLLVSDVGGPDFLLEGLLIGDEDSFFHKPTTLALQ
jgi:hypothetical protein